MRLVSFPVRAAAMAVRLVRRDAHRFFGHRYSVWWPLPRDVRCYILLRVRGRRPGRDGEIRNRFGQRLLGRSSPCGGKHRVGKSRLNLPDSVLNPALASPHHVSPPGSACTMVQVLCTLPATRCSGMTNAIPLPGSSRLTPVLIASSMVSDTSGSTIVKTISFSGSIGIPRRVCCSWIPVPRPYRTVPPSAPASRDLSLIHI